MKVVLASNNPGKIDEFSQLLEHLPITFIPQAALGIKDVAETGLTFIENALIKARYACHITGLPTIADDSGLTVPALRGAPGGAVPRFGRAGRPIVLVARTMQPAAAARGSVRAA